MGWNQKSDLIGIKLHDNTEGSFKTRAFLTGEKGCIKAKIAKLPICLKRYFYSEGSWILRIDG